MRIQAFKLKQQQRRGQLGAEALLQLLPQLRRSQAVHAKPRSSTHKTQSFNMS